MRVLSFLVYSMCCKEKMSQFRSAGKHVHTPGETTLLLTGTETSVDCFTDIGMSLPASALQEISDSSHAVFSSHTTPEAGFCLKWAPHACSGADHIPLKKGLCETLRECLQLFLLYPAGGWTSCFFRIFPPNWLKLLLLQCHQLPTTPMGRNNSYRDNRIQTTEN